MSTAPSGKIEHTLQESWGRPWAYLVSQDKKCGRGSAGGTVFPRKYLQEHVPRRAKQLCLVFGRNCNFCDFDPPQREGSGIAWNRPGWGHSPLLELEEWTPERCK
jgi:hypothetical protein